MSHVAYDLMLSDAMNDLQEQVKVEHVPAEKNEQGVANIDTWPNDEIFQHLACLYIKYIDIYRKLETCYDQIVHPQKRIFIKRVLESTIIRICEMKKDLVIFNPRSGVHYVHLDQLLFDLKYDPSIIEIPVPRYFAEDDKIKVDIAFKEKVERDAKKKKGKKGGKKKGGKKKKKGAEEVKEKEPRSMMEKEFLIDKICEQVHQSAEPEHEIVHDPFTLDMEIVSAIRLIQKNERGRQGRLRYIQINEQITKATEKKAAREGGQKKVEMTQQEKEYAAAEFAQRRIRGILARKQVEQMRQDEMVFLGMQRKPKTDEENRQGPLNMTDKEGLRRKQTQDDNMIVFDRAKQEIQDEIEAIEGNDIVDQMLKERRDWIQEQKAMAGGKPPKELAKFYDRHNLEAPLSPEEEAAKAAEEEAGGKKGKDKGKAKDKGKKGKGKKGGGDEEKTEGAKIGPTECIQKFDEFYSTYNDIWADRDETENYEQSYDREMARKEVLPIVEKEKEKIVDAMINQELKNMQILAKIKVKKPKKPKKPKKKKAKKNKLPGAKYIHDKDSYELLVELINHNIVKKLPPQKLTDFIGEFNYIHSMLDDITVGPRDPSMALIRQLVTEYIIFPLGSKLVRQRLPEHVRAFLFYGPAGTGKTLVVRAIAHETKSIVFDMSPQNIEGHFAASKADSDKMVAMVMVVAKEFEPSIIYIDEAEKVWPAKKKKKKGQKKPKKNDMSQPTRIKKTLLKWKAKWINEETRITIIACTSEPTDGNKKEFKKFFDKAIYFPFPDYTTRRLMWKHFVTEQQGKLKSDFPLSTLAHISAGYSAGSIKKTVENVLTEFRKSKMEQRPLSLAEFIGPLSLCINTMDDQYDEWKTLTDDLSGDKKRRAAIAAALAGDDAGGDPKKGKKGGKGKKKK